jgi:hypothetical protein
MIDRTEPATGIVAGVGGNTATLRAVGGRPARLIAAT